MEVGGNTQKILGTPYRWTVGLPDSVAQNQLIDWCKRCDGKFYLSFGPRLAHFELQDDAVSFILTWGNKWKAMASQSVSQKILTSNQPNSGVNNCLVQKIPMCGVLWNQVGALAPITHISQRKVKWSCSYWIGYSCMIANRTRQQWLEDTHPYFVEIPWHKQQGKIEQWCQEHIGYSNYRSLWEGIRFVHIQHASWFVLTWC